MATNRWTAEQAREMAKRGAAARWMRERARKAAVVLYPVTVTSAPTGAGLPNGNGNGKGEDVFVTWFLGALRRNIAALHSILDKELNRARIDAKNIHLLCSALGTLVELERITDGRPLPGSRRPPKEDSRRPTAPPMARPIMPILPTVPYTIAVEGASDGEEEKREPTPLDCL
jgi:hypothetical protein